MDLVEQLKRDEGLRLTPYKDSVGKLTIGYGRNLADKGINQSEAEFMLSNDIAEVATALVKAVPWVGDLDEARRGVLENMAFNLGVAGLLRFARTLAMIEAGDYDSAADAMLESKWANQVGERALRLSEQLRTGEWQ